MKLLPTTTRVSTSDSLGHGMDAALTLALFFGIGFALDRWLGTTPWFMVGLFLLASVAVFVKFRYQYEEQMSKLEAERRERSVSRTMQP